MAGSNTGGVKVDQDSEHLTQSTADMTAFVQNLLLQMQNRFQAMSEGIILKNVDEFKIVGKVYYKFVCKLGFHWSSSVTLLSIGGSSSMTQEVDEMGSKIDELEQSINDLKAEIGVEDEAKPKPQEDEPSHDAA